MLLCCKFNVFVYVIYVVRGLIYICVVVKLLIELGIGIIKLVDVFIYFC